MGTFHCTCNCMADEKNHEEKLEFRDENETLNLMMPVPLHKNYQEESGSLSFEESPIANRSESKPRRSNKPSDQVQTHVESNRSGVPKYNSGFELLEEVPVHLPSKAAKDKHIELGVYPFPNSSQNWRAIKLPDGSIYVGEWNSDAEPHGNGTMYYTDGGICEGQWAKGKLNGRGRQISANGDVYQGDWKFGLRSGKGKIEYADYFYEGSWENDLQHGPGLEKWKDGSCFEGQFALGKKNGQGTFVWKNRDSYTGDFKDNLLQGHGVYKWNNGREYSGTWKLSKMHGNGTFRWKDGRTYTGEYLDDLKCGWGVFHWPNGNRYEGYWKKGKQEGKGTIFDESGIGKTYIWKNGKPIRK